MYKEELFDEMEDASTPEIMRSNLAKVIIQLKAMGIPDVSGFDFIDWPSDLMFSQAFKQLKSLGCL